jgi:hypothetical protein
MIPLSPIPLSSTLAGMDEVEQQDAEETEETEETEGEG